MMKQRISVVINTLNEEKNLPSALASVQPWVDEIIVVDMHSEDRTVEVAHAFGATVYSHQRLDFADPARAFAISQATGNWILVLDADELVPLALSRKLCEIAQNDAADVVNIPWMNYVLGSPIHTGWGPKHDQHVRFFKRDKLIASENIHNFLTPVPGARMLTLNYADGHYVVHLSYRTFEEFLKKVNRYTTIEARQALARGDHPRLSRMTATVVKEFFWRFLWGEGYRDGWRGFYLSVLMALYRFITYAKLTALRHDCSVDRVTDAYDRVAERVIAEYASNTSVGREP